MEVCGCSGLAVKFVVPNRAMVTAVLAAFPQPVTKREWERVLESGGGYLDTDNITSAQHAPTTSIIVEDAGGPVDGNDAGDDITLF